MELTNENDRQDKHTFLSVADSDFGPLKFHPIKGGGPMAYCLVLPLRK